MALGPPAEAEHPAAFAVDWLLCLGTAAFLLLPKHIPQWEEVNTMPTQRKVESVADLTDKLTRTQLTLVTDYRGLTVAEITDLRKKLRDTGAELIVAKNTLTLRAAKETGHEALESLVSGPTALAFAFQDAARTAKAISDFNKAPEKLVVRGGVLGNALLGEIVLDEVSSLAASSRSWQGSRWRPFAIRCASLRDCQVLALRSGSSFAQRPGFR